MMFLLLVTLMSMLLAVVMSVVAWRVANEERHRSHARVAALAAAIHDPEGAVRHPSRLDDELEIRRASDTTVNMPGLFAKEASAQPIFRLAAVVGIGVVVFGSAVAIAVMFGSGSQTTSVPVESSVGAELAPPPGPTSASGQDAWGWGATRSRKVGPYSHTPTTTDVPLELIALGHEREGDRLTVRGAIRNPSMGADVDRLTAVVFLFSRDGVFLASGRAAVHASATAPGGESMFVVTVPGASNVGRYRVSFRTDDRVVPHVDRREHAQEKS